MKSIIFKNKYILIFFLAAFSLLSGCEKKESDNRAFISISSDPSGAAISIDGRECGITPLKSKIVPGTYILKISKINYEPSWTKIICAPKSSKTAEVILKPISASVMIRSNPPGAELQINGETIGETPLTIHDQPIGKYSGILKKPGYISTEVTWEISNHRPQIKTTVLNSNMGSLVITSTPPNAKIFIDDAPKGSTPFNGTVEQGTHKIRLVKEGYAVAEETMNITKNEKKAKAFALQLLPGSITVKSEPSGAIIIINGEQHGKTPATIKDLKPGSYQLRLERGGCDPIEKQLTVSAGKNIEESFTLDSNTGGIDVVVNPPGVTIYIDGKKAGISEPDENNSISKVFSRRNLSADSHKVEFWHKRAVPERKSITVKVQKGKVTRAPNVNMWIANAVLTLRNGRVMTGILASENKDEVFFEPEPGVRQGYKRNEIISLIPLKFEE